MKALYTATTTVHGGREGSIESSDGVLKHNLSMPKELEDREVLVPIQSNYSRLVMERVTRVH